MEISLEQEYTRTVPLAHRKRYAQFFTPGILAEFMVDWVTCGRCGGHYLEPALGLGIFSRRILLNDPTAWVDAFELDSIILDLAKTHFMSKRIAFACQDYLTAPWAGCYEGIVCNPPYLKYAEFDYQRVIPLVDSYLNTKLSKFTNLYALFLLKSLAQLAPGGRLAYLIPSEFLNANFGIEVKRYLLRLGWQVHIIVFSSELTVFEGVQSTACILLVEHVPSDGFMRFSSVSSLSELGNVFTDYRSVPMASLIPEEPWGRHYADSSNRCYQHLIDLSTYARVTRGIASGCNSFFALRRSEVEAAGLPSEVLVPCIAHGKDVSGVFFTEADLQRLMSEDKQVLLFNGVGKESFPAVANYIHHGEQTGVSKRYLCAHRSPWYAIEKRLPAPIWVSVFNRTGLRFVRNETAALTMATFHGLYMVDDRVDVGLFFAYLLTDLAKEVLMDNARRMGDGLIKFEPNDLNQAKVVDLSFLSSSEVASIKGFYRNYRESAEPIWLDRIEQVFVERYRVD